MDDAPTERPKMVPLPPYAERTDVTADNATPPLEAFAPQVPVILPKPTRAQWFQDNKWELAKIGAMIVALGIGYALLFAATGVSPILRAWIGLH